MAEKENQLAMQAKNKAVSCELESLQEEHRLLQRLHDQSERIIEECEQQMQTHMQHQDKAAQETAQAWAEADMLRARLGEAALLHRAHAAEMGAARQTIFDMKVKSKEAEASLWKAALGASSHECVQGLLETSEQGGQDLLVWKDAIAARLRHGWASWDSKLIEAFIEKALASASIGFPEDATRAAFKARTQNEQDLRELEAELIRVYDVLHAQHTALLEAIGEHINLEHPETLKLASGRRAE